MQLIKLENIYLKIYGFYAIIWGLIYLTWTRRGDLFIPAWLTLQSPRGHKTRQFSTPDSSFRQPGNLA